MPVKAIKTFTSGSVERRLEICPQRFFPVQPNVGETLGGGPFFAVYMRCRGALFGKESILVLNTMLGRLGPKFHHGEVASSEAFQGVDRRTVRPARFGMDTELVLMC